MKNWMKKNRILMKVLSLVLSFLLWFYVIYVDNPERTVTFSNIPVRLLNTEYLRRYLGLIVTNEEQPTVTVKLSGTFTQLEEITADDIRVTADLSKLTEAGEYTLSYDISALDGVTVVQRSQDISVTLGELATVELPVEVKIDGNLSKDLYADTAIADPKTVSVTGLKETLENAECVQVTVDAAALKETCEDDYSFELVNAGGKVIESDEMSFDTSSVHVKIPIERIKSVPLTFNFVYGGGASKENTLVKLSQNTLTVVGDMETVDAIEQLVVDTIDTTAFTQELHEEYTISLPEGVRIYDGEQTVTADVTFTDLEVRQIVVNDIQLENIPTDYQITLNTEQVLVSVRGTTALLNTLEAGDIALTADLSSMVPDADTQTIPASVVLSERVGTLGVFGDYTVTVTAAQQNSEPTTEETTEEVPEEVSVDA